MGFKHVINEFSCRNGDRVRGLLDLNPIVVVDKTHVGKGRFVFAKESEACANGHGTMDAAV